MTNRSKTDELFNNIPDSIKNSKYYKLYKKTLHQSIYTYNQLLEEGIPEDEAKIVLPIALFKRGD